jgi:hypothetical protein
MNNCQSVHIGLTDGTSTHADLSGAVGAGYLPNDIIGKEIITATPPVKPPAGATISIQLVAILDDTQSSASVTVDFYNAKIAVKQRNPVRKIDAAGTAYNLTNTSAAVTFGTTSPALTLYDSGLYLIEYEATINYAGATFAASQDATLKLRRTNNTATDLSGSSRIVKTDIVTTKTATMQYVKGSCIYQATATDDAIALFGSVAATPSAGNLQVAQASIIATKIGR